MRLNEPVNDIKRHSVERYVKNIINSINFNKKIDNKHLLIINLFYFHNKLQIDEDKAINMIYGMMKNDESYEYNQRKRKVSDSIYE